MGFSIEYLYSVVDDGEFAPFRLPRWSRMWTCANCLIIPVRRSFVHEATSRRLLILLILTPRHALGGWVLGTGGVTCTSVCSTVSMACDSSEFLARLTEVDTPFELESVMQSISEDYRCTGCTASGSPCSAAYSTLYQTANAMPAVHGYDATSGSIKKQCFTSTSATTIASYESKCSEVPSHSSNARLCYCMPSPPPSPPPPPPSPPMVVSNNHTWQAKVGLLHLQQFPFGPQEPSAACT